jgi:hypothetical protein
VHDEGIRRGQHRVPGNVRQAAPDAIRSANGRRAGQHHLIGDILHWNRVGGHDPARLPDQHSPGAVHDSRTAQGGPDAFGGRFVPQLAQPARQQTTHLNAHRPAFHLDASLSMIQD